MAVPMQHLGFREVIPDQSALIQWRSIVIDTGAAQSTLQDIKVPEYGGGYAYKVGSAITRNRYIYWRVCHDIVELWEESLDYDLVRNHVQLRFADTPILEGLSVHETNHHVVILLATVSSVHRIRLPHPQNSTSKGSSILSELTFQTLKDHHNLHLLNNSVTGNVATSGEGLPHTAGTHLVSSSADGGTSGCGDAIFILAQAGGALMVVRMTDLPYSVHTHAIKNASLMNRLFTGFVPGMFRGMEGGETVTSLVLVEMGGDVMALGVCRDARIRAWSCTRLECIMAHDSLENTAEAGKKLQPGAQRHLVRSLTEGDGVSLGVFLNFAEKQLMLVYHPAVNMGQLSITHIKTLYPPQYDLVDFSLTSEFIWSLWVDSNNETQLLYASVSGDGDSSSDSTPGLSSAVLSQPPDKEVTLTDTTLDPREIYLKQLFTPNLFSAHTIRKALGIYRRNVDFMRLMEGGMRRLREEVESALRDEVEARMTTDLTDEEVTELTLEAWANFYCHTLQYHQVGQAAVGLVGVGGLGLVGVVRKQCVSWMRPMDALEVLALAPIGSSTLTRLAQHPVLSEDGAVMSAAVGLAGPLRCIRQALAPEVAAAFTLDLLHLEPPDQVSGSIVMSLLSDGESWNDGSSLSSSLGQQLASIAGGLVPGIRAYLDALQIDGGIPDAVNLNGTSTPGIPDWITLSLGGQVGSSIIGAVVAQFARVRLELCRDLLLLQHMALQLGTQCRLTPENSAQLRSTLVPKTSMLTQAYFALLHIATTPAVRPATHTLEVSRRQLAALSLDDAPSLPPGNPGGRPQLVLELLVQGSSGSNIRALVASCLEGDIPQSWAALLPPLAATVARFAWPISHCLALPEFLVWCGQHGAVQEYVRLLQPWCEWNSCSRKFLLAVALLNQGEPDKAARLFLQAIEGVTTEDFLGVKVCGGSPESSPDQLRVQYCLRVIRLLEQSGQTALALQVAGEGVSMAGVDDPACSALYSVVFKHQLELGHHDEAFTAMLACPDDHRRRNCLRQLIVSLHERKCLNLLVNYQYGHLEPEVINILENRARSADILVNNYYDLLFAFHVKKHNFKKAACVMYECAMRLNLEGMGEKGLRQQAKCYLSCLNCLRHIQPDQAWIVKPLPSTVVQDTTDENVLGFGVSPKRSSDGAVLAAPLARKRAQVQVLEVKDLEREYQAVHARLKLFKMKQQQALQHNSGGGPMSPADTISLLTHAKLFRDALRLSNLFDIEVSPVLEGLANACIVADQSQDKISQWEWLAENGVQKDHTDSSQWWLLLKELLQEQEKGGQSHLHLGVTTTLLSHSNTLPTWLIHSYKKCNSAELLRLYVGHGLLEDAVRLSCEYIDGLLLGVATDQVGLTNPLQANAAPVWMPYTALDKLLLELKEVQSNSYFKQLHDTLDCKLKVYQEELHRVSADRLIYLQG